jgi:PKD repeat protein
LKFCLCYSYLSEYSIFIIPNYLVMRTIHGLLIFCSVLFGFQNLLSQEALDPYIVGNSILRNGLEIKEVIVPGHPPIIYRSPAVVTNIDDVMLDSVPAYSWSFGCSNTSAAMMAGYYDLHQYPSMYTAITNDGYAPLDNLLWGTVTINGEIRNQCPLSATMLGLDERPDRGHVNDFWVVYHHFGPDPYLSNGWNRHEDGDCTGDFMGTNQSVLANSDGNTRFFFIPDGTPLLDYTGNEPGRRDGCHGFRLFVESRGYGVIENYTQLIMGMYGNTRGFTIDQYKEEIDNGRPVLLQLSGHTMTGVGYSSVGNTIYLHDTWDNALHSMPWGGSYAGMAQWGVTIMRLESDTPAPQTNFTASSNTLCSGELIQFSDLSQYNPDSWEWTFEGGTPGFSSVQSPVIMYDTPGNYTVSLRTTNDFGYDTETRYDFIQVSQPCYCTPGSNCGNTIAEVRFSDITHHSISCENGGYAYFPEQPAFCVPGHQYPLLVRCKAQVNIPMQCVVWFDWNKDFSFDDVSELNLLSGNLENGVFTGIIAIHDDILPGTYRMRIRLLPEGQPSPCVNAEAGETEDFIVEVLPDTACQTLHLKFFPEGLYDPATGLLNQVMAGNQTLFPSPWVDIVDVCIADDSSPFEEISCASNSMIDTNGECLADFPAGLDGDYYLVIKHRNSVETWSSLPISFDNQCLEYDFTDLSMKAFGGNLAPCGGSYCLFAGDVNQDGIIDSGDMICFDNMISLFLSGYFPEDFNGDGLIDSSDYIWVDNNSSLFISRVSPE